MAKLIPTTLLFFFLSFFSEAQCPVAGFSGGGPVCPGTPVAFTNTSTHASTYLWDFCAGDFSTVPTAADNPTVTPDPYGMTTVFDGTNWYGFEVNESTASITRFDFGPSLSNNNPSSVVLSIAAGYLFAPLINNISILKEGGNWYGIIANFGSGNNLARLDFGASLSNTSPTPSVLTIQHLNSSLYQTLVVDSGNIYLFFCNYGDNNLVVSNFGNSINNTPVNSFIPVPVASSLSEIAFTKICNHWYGLMACFSGSVASLDFGASLSNPAPVISAVTVPGLATPLSIAIDNDGEGWFGFIQNNDAGILKLSFGSSITNTPVTTALPLPGLTGIAKKLTLVREGSNHYLFGSGGGNNHFAKILFAAPCSASVPVSDSLNASVLYATGGTHFIGLTVWDSVGNMDFHFDSLAIIQAPLSDFSFANTIQGDTTFFTNLSTIINGTIASQLWKFGDGSTDTSQNPAHFYTTSGQDTVSLTSTASNGCSNTKTIILSIIPNVQAGFLTADTVCAGLTVPVTNTSTHASTYLWDFCAGDFSTVPTAADNPTVTPDPYGMTTVFDGTNWYGFEVNESTASITRFDFGPSLSNNNPSSVVLSIPAGYLFAPLINNISILKEGGNWYGIIANFGSGNNLARLDFGASLSNTSPTPSVLTIQHLNSSLYQTLVVDSGNIYLFFCNYGDNNLVVSNFGNSINNTPVNSFIPVPVASSLSEIAFTKIHNHWYGLMACFSGSVASLDFGASLSNPSPVISAVTVPGLATPLSIAIDNDGEGWFGFIQNNDAGILKLSFGSSITNTPVTTALPLPGLTGIAKKLTLVREGSNHYLFGSGGGNNHFAKILFARPCSAFPATSASAAPVTSYLASGNYNIALTAWDAWGNPSFHYDSLSVKIAPIPDFSVANTCLGDITLFTDSSFIAVPESITSYDWDFGDSTTGSGSHQAHIYSATGSYQVTLTTSSSDGCTTTKSKTVFINATPTASFSVPTACSETPIQFTDLSTIPSGNIVTWQWSFGNGDTSAIRNPVYSYPAGGSYVVSLQAISDSGCFDKILVPVDIDFRPQSDFVVSNTCVGAGAQFIDLTVSQSAVTSYHWDFGDAGTDTIANPLHFYPVSVATYTVAFIVQAANGCIDTTIQTVKINNIPTAAFNFSPVNICEGNSVSFHDLSSVVGDTINAWHWDFGDGDTSYIRNPVHQYADTGNYIVTLVAYSPTSCPNSTSMNVHVIESPHASFSNTSVCHGGQTVFTDHSTAPTGNFITSYFWNYHDSFTDTTQNPVHTFLNAGNHLVTLTVTTDVGCNNTDSVLVHVNPLPVASFLNTIPCTINAVHFTNTTTIDSTASVLLYSWNFGDLLSSSNSSNLPNPTHIYSDTGSVVVTLIATSDSGCADTAYQVLDVLQASLANFQHQPTCYGDLVRFTNLSSGPDSAWVWSFGDTQFDQLENPAHFYATPDTFYVTLTVYATTGCISTVTKPVVVSPIPNAAFVHHPGCIGSPYQFTDSSYIASGSIVTWKWNFGGLDSSSLQNPRFNFPDTGSYTISLTATSDIGCQNTVTRPIQVYALPQANFSFNPQYGNPPLNVNFTNLSTGASFYDWNFGDGDTSMSANPQHLYTDTSLYTIRLISISSNGCRDTMDKSIYIIKPVLDIAVTNLSSYMLDDHLHIIADLANLGTRVINNFRMEAWIEDGTPVSESYVRDLPVGYSGQLELVSSFFMGNSNAKYYCVSALDPNGTADDVSSNNELCKSLTKEFSVINPYPNPFDQHLYFQLVLPYKDNLTIDLFDMEGKNVLSLSEEGHEGLNLFDADLGSEANGLYAVRFRFRETEVIRTVMKAEKKK